MLGPARAAHNPAPLRDRGEAALLRLMDNNDDNNNVPGPNNNVAAPGNPQPEANVAAPGNPQPDVNVAAPGNLQLDVNAATPGNPQPDVNMAAPGNPPPAANGDAANTDNGNNTVNEPHGQATNGETTSNANAVPAGQEEPPVRDPRSFLSLSLTFVVALFSSLIPDQPDVI